MVLGDRDAQPGHTTSAERPVATQPSPAARPASNGTAGSLSGSFSVLPPIAGGGSGPAGCQSGRSGKLGELEEITLKNEIYRNAELIQERRVQRLLNEMRTLDRDRDGVLEPIQVKRTLRKHQLKFTPEVEDNLVLKFQQTPKTVQYEKLVQYLGLVKLEASRTIDAPPVAQHQALPRPGRAFTERDELLLKEDLSAFLRPRLLDLEQLSRTFYDLDRDRNGFLSAAQVETGLHRAGLADMPSELMRRLCTAADRQGNGLSNIDKITTYVERSMPAFSRATLQGLGNNHHPRAPREPAPVSVSTRPAPITYQPRLTQQVRGASPVTREPAPVSVSTRPAPITYQPRLTQQTRLGLAAPVR
ncbi:uncharacterized protein LOC119098058 [Pollicipes pollicipes]|uniref:uncharacterized protein LOC119098058 n=1 Tax=Pollicipes pollicipes TaxID=41117 RepID=UPI001884D849|nr:uncharacterized protein LOC119098058 [Pollicipes pollicipes]